MSKKTILFITLILALLLCAVIGIFLNHDDTQPTQHEAVAVDQTDLPSKATSCAAQSTRNWAYRVSASVQTRATTSQKSLYQSNTHFTLSLAEQAQQVKGLASEIRIQENGQDEKTLPDVTFLAFNAANTFAQFGFFDDLGLSANHPMKLLNPLVKHLSVAPEGETVTYAYDPLGVSYRYQHTFPKVTRSTHQTPATNPTWSVTLGDDCLVETLDATEQLPFKLGNETVMMRYHFQAKRIPSHQSLDTQAFAANTNRDNTWNSAVVTHDASPEVTTDTAMWQAFEGFANNKNTGLLKKAADYLVKNHTPSDVANMLTQASVSEAAKRELAFGLSLAEGAHVPDYILDTLAALPAKTNAQGDVQKVRLMVALTGRNDVTTQSFDRLMGLRQAADTSDNVKNNVLISSGKVAKDLAQKGETQALQTFETEVKTQLQTYDDNAASAILASGNAELTTVTTQTIKQLQQGTEKSRYAAATVLLRDPSQYDVLTAQLNKEQSPIVFQTIVSGLDKNKLSANNKVALSALVASLEASQLQTSQLQTSQPPTSQPQNAQTQSVEQKITLLKTLVSP